MKFGAAIERMKAGGRVARAGWNGKHMYVYLMPGFSGPEGLTYDPCIVMRTAQGSLQPGWLASQADMLAEDWDVVAGD